MQTRITTKPGRLSFFLIVQFFLFFLIFLLVAVSGQRGPGFNPWLAIPIGIAGLCGIAAFFTGIVAILKEKERSVTVFISTAIGFLILLFAVGEFAVPH